MIVRTKQEFETFMSQLLATNANLAFYTDFQKCSANVNSIAIKLNTLNYLIGQADMEQAVRALWDNDPKVFSVLDILIAVRTNDKKMVLNEKGEAQYISKYFETVDGVIAFIKQTGLEEFFSNRQIKNLVDYVFGVEVGLDTNARKNRSGRVMERLIAETFTKSGIKFRQEVYSTEYPPIADVLGEDKKRFDFVVETETKTYLMEVNFYSGGGSKLNEVARAYSELAPKINSVDGFEFVWITDGKGWHSASNKLEEAFYAIPSIYNLTTIKDFIAALK
ncbi:type II restriction endonuclease [uncultured Prevotella sp.]|uniref:type II restriction endonuclease n=1 Tax=uncultured Prevotella sp. TaxID=159272 RepID=UPI0026145405|nr:type II restriction endonuclease [uncultured Prevotella sp.]